MAKIKLTRNELKTQREALKRYTRFLPTLELKKLQLQLEKRKIDKKIAEAKEKLMELKEQVKDWTKLFAEKNPKSIEKLVILQEVVTGELNIAGTTVPTFEKALFKIEEYDLWSTPPWLDQGLEMVQKIISRQEEIHVLEKQSELISKELRKTTQRINLFKERLVPECKENIRKIRIHLGDVLAAAVCRSKIAKQKLQKSN